MSSCGTTSRSGKGAKCKNCGAPVIWARFADVGLRPATEVDPDQYVDETAHDPLYHAVYWLDRAEVEARRTGGAPPVAHRVAPALVGEAKRIELLLVAPHATLCLDDPLGGYLSDGVW